MQKNLSIAMRRTLGWLMIGGLLLAAANAVRAAGTGLSAEQKISQLRIVRPQPASGLPGKNPGLHLPHPCLASEEVNRPAVQARPIRQRGMQFPGYKEGNGN